MTEQSFRASADRQQEMQIDHEPGSSDITLTLDRAEWRYIVTKLQKIETVVAKVGWVETFVMRDADRKVRDRALTEERFAALASEIDNLRDGLTRMLATRPRLETVQNQLDENISAEDYNDIALSALFDAGWYLANYPDVARDGIDPVYHYLAHGVLEGREPSPHFSGSEYLAANPDVVTFGMNPLLHFVRHGAYENRLLRPQS